jgi:hypothetical protein
MIPLFTDIALMLLAVVVFILVGGSVVFFAYDAILTIIDGA